MRAEIEKLLTSGRTAYSIAKRLEFLYLSFNVLSVENAN